MAVVVGLALGRFLFLEPSVAPAAIGPAPTTIEGRIDQLERLAADGSEDPNVFQQLGSSYIIVAAQTGDPLMYTQADAALRRADSLAPDQPATLIARATLANVLHQFDEAHDLATRALDTDPTSIEGLAALADAQVELGHYQEAADTVQAMLDLDPGVPALSRASYLRQLYGDMPGALRLMHQARAAAGTPYLAAAVDSLLGEVYTAAGQPAEALAAYEQAENAWPGMSLAITGRARSLAMLGRTDEAIEILMAETERATALGPVILLADLLAAQGRGDEAADAYELVEVIGLLQEEAGAIVDLELAISRAGRGLDTAVASAEAVFAARPDNIYAADAMAWALHRTGRTAEAVAHIEQALR
ncbi:MAG: tetratricopeptide repeat protein, partial [Acidimicrobiia bacterium]|nr:tetratricopeptide repeat protein [Acidimicrobiia bacterium]